MGDQDRLDPERVERPAGDDRVERRLGRRRDEQRQQARAHDDLGRRHRQEDQAVDRAAAAERVARQGQPDQRPEDRRDDRRDDGDEEARPDRLRQPLPVERVEPAVEREAVPGEVELALVVVEAEDDHHDDRQQQVEDGDGGERRQRVVRQRRPEAARGAARRGRGPLERGGRRPSSPSSARQLLGPEEPGVDRAPRRGSRPSG